MRTLYKKTNASALILKIKVNLLFKKLLQLLRFRIKNTANKSKIIFNNIASV